MVTRAVPPEQFRRSSSDGLRIGLGSPVVRQTPFPPSREGAPEQAGPRPRFRPFGFPRSVVASFGIHATLIATAFALGLSPLAEPGRVYFRTSMAFDRPESSVDTWLADVEPPREPQAELLPEPELLPVEPSEPDPEPAPEPEPELADPADMTQVWASVSLEPLRRLNPPEIEEVSSAPETPADSPRPVEVAEADPEPVVAEPQVTDPELVHHPPPSYPEAARRLGQKGVVVLSIRVSAAGEVIEVAVAESSGFRLLDRAAVAAVEKWKFRPATENGLPVGGTFEHVIRFHLTAS